MNPFQTSQGSANSSPSNLNRMVSLLNSMVTDLNLPNVQPKTTEIPERPVSAESGYISGKEDKQKSNVKAFEKPFTSCKEAKSETNEVSELKTIHEPQSKFLDQVPVVRKAVEPTTEKVPESAGQRGIPDSETPESRDPEDLTVNVAANTRVPEGSMKPTGTKSVPDGSTIQKGVPGATSKGSLQVAHKSRLVAPVQVTNPRGSTGAKPKTFQGLTQTSAKGSTTVSATPKIVVRKAESKPVRTVPAETSKASFNRATPLTSSLRAPVKSGTQVIPSKDTKLVRTSSLRAPSTTKPLQSLAAHSFGLKRSDSIKSLGNASFNAKTKQFLQTTSRTGMTVRLSTTAVTPRNSANIRKLGSSSPSLNLQVKKPLNRLGSSNPDLKVETGLIKKPLNRMVSSNPDLNVETGIKKPAARMNSVSKDDAKRPGRFGFSNPDLNQPTGNRKPDNPLSSSSQELYGYKSGSKANPSATAVIKPSGSVTSTGSGIASRLHSSSLKPKGLVEATKKSPLRKK